MYNENDKQAYEYDLNLLEDKEPYATAIAREIIENETYNGWVNRETCVVALHLSNDYELHHQALAKIREAGNTNNAANSIEEWVKEQHAILHHEPHNRIPKNWANLLADAGSLWRVDWQEVAESFIE